MTRILSKRNKNEYYIIFCHPIFNGKYYVLIDHISQEQKMEKQTNIHFRTHINHKNKVYYFIIGHFRFILSKDALNLDILSLATNIYKKTLAAETDL